MSAISDDRLAAQLEQELSQPEPGMYFGATLLIGTLVASPVLIAGATGRHSVPTALAVYAGVLVVVWFLVGLFGSVLSLQAPEATEPEEALDAADGSALFAAETPAPETAEPEPAPPAGAE